MITEIPLGVLCGYIGTAWCVGNLLWALFRNDATRALIYGSAVLLATIVALNIGGVLNEEVWNLFGLGVFGAHLIYVMFIHRSIVQAVLFAMMFCISVLAFVGWV